MKQLHKKNVQRRIALFLLLVFLQPLLLPFALHAESVGPHQPEYTSYEAPGATDLVNLATGDFGFSIPILDVPGPEGGFSLPLSYSAGIGLEQEASWVGLGWNVNVGAITRSINGYPDDANGESQSVTVQDLVGLRGWNTKTLGLGSFGWNNQQGHYGSLSLLSIVNAEWDSHNTSVGVIGFNVSNDGFYVDPVQAALGIASLISFGAGGAAAGAIAKEVAISSAVSVAMDGAMSFAQGSSTPLAGNWEYSKTEKKNWGLKIATGGINNVNEYKIWLDKSRSELMYGALYLGNAPTESYNFPDVTIKVNQTTVPTKRYLLSSTTLNEGAASDINYLPSTDESKHYIQVNNPAIVATDNITVRMAGISGSITPYRLEVGSASMPREMSSDHMRLVPVPYLANNLAMPLDNSNYKVPFIYKGMLSNSYFHQVGSATAVNSPNFYNGISASSSNGITTLNFDDVVFSNSQRIKSSLPSSKKISQANHIEWLTNNEVKSAVTYSPKFIDALNGTTSPITQTLAAGTPISTNSERYIFRTKGSVGLSSTSYTANFNHLALPVKSDVTASLTNANVDLAVTFYNNATDYANGTVYSYVEFKNLQVHSVNTTNNTFRIDNPSLYPFEGKVADISIKINTSSLSAFGVGNSNSVGGFSITASDGSTYHFALPIYDYDLLSETREIANPNTRRSLVRRYAPFANAWVLTAITGSDFIDRNQNGLADTGDWGNWVKFNYGFQTNNFEWRVPYSGYKAEAGGIRESFSQGKNQLYYLNSIETRSHVALFLKSTRADSKSANNVNINPHRLDEIILVTRTVYDKLRTDYALPEFSNSITNLCLSTQFSSQALRSFVDLNCLRRILFSYDYSLCNGTPNSSSGKLTLKALSILGRSNKKLVPDYKFIYANNPSYDFFKWDSWGMYSQGGTSSVYSHGTNQANTNQDASAWSLTQIKTPLGAEINVNYQRDDYSLVGGSKFYTSSLSYTMSGTQIFYPSGFPIRTLAVNNQSNTIKAGDRVRVAGTLDYTCPRSSGVKNFIQDDLRVVAATTTSVTVDGDFVDVSDCSPMTSGQFISCNSFYGTIYKYSDGKKGEGIRVESITTRDEFGGENRIKYLYSMEDNVVSSGAIFQEPAFEGGMGRSEIPGYPVTPVMYGRVSVLNGRLTDDNDYHSKQVYEFETPNSSHYYLVQNQTNTSLPNVKSFENQITDNTLKIGALKSIKVFDRAGNLYSAASFSYTNDVRNDGVNAFQGTYASSLIMLDGLVIPPNDDNALKLNRTTVIQYPNTVDRVTTTKDGLTTETKNLSWDILTGQVNRRLDKSSLGIYMLSVTKPAYLVYPQMGSKAVDINNRNMLSQTASTYSYRSNETGAQLGLISASAQTWRSDWSNYRFHNGTSYVETPAEAISQSNPVWRKSKSYVFRGNFNLRQSDGSLKFSPSDEYNFQGSNPLWQFVGENVRFDHFGMPLESKDLNSLFSAVKLGYGELATIAEASNAEYCEIAFSSAEDALVNGFFGGEVALKTSGDATVVNRSLGYDTHTGDRAISLSTGNGFVFKPCVLKPNKQYRIAAWTNSVNGRLFYKLNGGSEILSATPTKQGKPGWYLMELIFTTGATVTSIEAGVKSSSGTVLFDDFRFQPLVSSMTCYVYNPLDYFVTGTGTSLSNYILGNDNLFTRYETFEDGLTTATYQESFQYGERKVSETRSDYRRFHIDQ